MYNLSLIKYAQSNYCCKLIWTTMKYYVPFINK